VDAREQGDERGVEPDECYVFGEVGEPTRPDLAIEVVWTSGRLDKLPRSTASSACARSGLAPRGRLAVHALRGESYEAVAASEVLPGIDLVELVQFLDRSTASRAIRDYRATIEARLRP
jgi:hypothetical protein